MTAAFLSSRTSPRTFPAVPPRRSSSTTTRAPDAGANGEGRDPHRHWRLDLSAVARGLLSAEAAAIEGARVRGPDIRRDRDQRDLLWPPKPEKLGGVGSRGSRRLPVRDQGLALLRHPAADGRRG